MVSFVPRVFKGFRVEERGGGGDASFEGREGTKV